MEPLTIIINALIDKGGFWGVIASAIFFWNMYKESSASKKEKLVKSEIKAAKDEFKEKEEMLLKKIEDLSESINSLQEQNKKLLQELNSIELSRIDDLKELLTEYHRTASDTLKALEKFEFFLTNK